MLFGRRLGSLVMTCDLLCSDTETFSGAGVAVSVLQEPANIIPDLWASLADGTLQPQQQYIGGTRSACFVSMLSAWCFVFVLLALVRCSRLPQDEGLMITLRLGFS